MAAKVIRSALNKVCGGWRPKPEKKWSNAGQEEIVKGNRARLFSEVTVKWLESMGTY